jgi:low temperature requirement protein LtrA
VIAVVEMILNIAISSRWKVVGFKRTHLVERMSLLTLYILGEGVIDVLKSIGTVGVSLLLYIVPSTNVI